MRSPSPLRPRHISPAARGKQARPVVTTGLTDFVIIRGVGVTVSRLGARILAA